LFFVRFGFCQANSSFRDVSAGQHMHAGIARLKDPVTALSGRATRRQSRCRAPTHHPAPCVMSCAAGPRLLVPHPRTPLSAPVFSLGPIRPVPI
jgi:hypothetical protein